MKWRTPEELESEANELIRSMPSDLTTQLRGNRGNESIMKRMIGDFIKTTKIEQDRRLIETTTRLFQTEGDFYRTHAATSRAKADAVRAQHEVQQIQKKLGREDELTALDHKAKRAESETRLAEQQAKRAAYRADKSAHDSKRQSIGEDEKVRLRRQLDDALARKRTYDELEDSLERSITDELAGMEKIGVQPERRARRERELRRFSQLLLKEFRRALAKRTAGSSDERTES